MRRGNPWEVLWTVSWPDLTERGIKPTSGFRAFKRLNEVTWKGRVVISFLAMAAAVTVSLSGGVSVSPGIECSLFDDWGQQVAESGPVTLPAPVPPIERPSGWELLGAVSVEIRQPTV